MRGAARRVGAWRPHEMPFVTARDAQLQSRCPGPLPTTVRECCHDGRASTGRAAGFGIADVSARSFDREPAVRGSRARPPWRRQLGARPGYAQLGARWVLEPVPMRVVSGLVFGDIDVVEAPRLLGRGCDGDPRYRLRGPGDVCRLGLPSDAHGGGAVFLQGAASTTALEADQALADESVEWRWVAIRRRRPARSRRARRDRRRSRSASLSVAVDVSGVRLVAEDQGVRLWEWDHAAAVRAPRTRRPQRRAPW